MSDLVVIDVTEQPKIEIVIPQTGVLPTVAGVASFNGRTGIVVPQSGDYLIGQISGAAVVASTGDYNDLINTPSLVFAPISHVGSTGVSEHGVATGAMAGFMAAADKTKLDGITSGATANQTDAYLLNRSNHTGTQPANTVTGLATVATSGNYSDLSGTPSSLPPSGSASGELTGSYPAPTLVNAAVIAKVLTGMAGNWNLPVAADSILAAIGKLAVLSTIQPHSVDSNVTLPSGHTWLRGKTKISDGYKITIQNGAKLKVF